MKHLLIIFLVALFTCKGTAQSVEAKTADLTSFHSVCASLLEEVKPKAPPAYLLDVKGKEYVISSVAIDKKLIYPNWITSIEVISLADEGTDEHPAQLPSIIFKLNTKQYPRAFTSLRRYLKQKF
jgi:hypothetical protein